MKGFEIYQKLSRPPQDALKTITGGKLNGKSDINPQWRYKAMTEQFGLIGIGWKFQIDRVWTEAGANDEVMVFAEVSVFIKDYDNDVWSEAIPGLGGSTLVKLERGQLVSNDEGYKMAVTDALGTALKMLGVAADIYAGLWDGSKYKDSLDLKAKPQPRLEATPAERAEFLNLIKTEINGKPVFSKEEKEKFAELRNFKTAAEVIALVKGYIKRAEASLKNKANGEPIPEVDLDDSVFDA